jgi:hypothetical protein
MIDRISEKMNNDLRAHLQEDVSSFRDVRDKRL